jgi:acyl-homoserine lactone acylase PvdQ
MIPVPFYPQTIVLPDIRMTGIAVVGLPGILTGRNSFMAWGFTNNNGDQQDLFIETIHPQNPSSTGARSICPVRDTDRTHPDPKRRWKHE